MSASTPKLEAPPEAIAAATRWRTEAQTPQELTELLTWVMRATVALMSQWSSTEAPKLLSGTTNPVQPRSWCVHRLAASLGMREGECAELCEAAIAAVGWPSEATQHSGPARSGSRHHAVLAAQRKRERKNARRKREGAQ